MAEAKASSCLDLTSPGMRRACFSRGRVCDLPRGNRAGLGGICRSAPWLVSFKQPWWPETHSVGLYFLGKTRLASCLVPMGCRGPGCSTPEESRDPFVLRCRVQRGEAAHRFVRRSQTLSAKLGSSAGLQAMRTTAAVQGLRLGPQRLTLELSQGASSELLELPG